MKNLKKLIYQYNFLKLELSEREEEHTELVAQFEKLFSDYIPKDNTTEEELREKAKENDSSKSKKRTVVSESTKKVYKDVAKHLHPDAGGDDDSFRELNNRYKSNDLLGVVTMAVENGVNVELDEDDVVQLQKSISDIEAKISHLDTTLAYVWKYGNKLQKYSVIASLGDHLGKPIVIENLPDAVKKELE